MVSGTSYLRPDGPWQAIWAYEANIHSPCRRPACHGSGHRADYRRNNCVLSPGNDRLCEIRRDHAPEQGWHGERTSRRTGHPLWSPLTRNQCERRSRDHSGGHSRHYARTHSRTASNGDTSLCHARGHSRDQPECDANAELKGDRAQPIRLMPRKVS